MWATAHLVDFTGPTEDENVAQDTVTRIFFGGRIEKLAFPGHFAEGNDGRQYVGRSDTDEL